MGSSQSATEGGFQIFKVIPGSPADESGLEVCFDFIIGVDGRAVAQGQSLTWVEDKSVKLHVLNSKSRRVREVTVTPRKWGGDGLLGARVSYKPVPDNPGVRVLMVYPNSPAAEAGLIAYDDYLLGTDFCMFDELEPLIELVQDALASPEDGCIKMYVYRASTESIRQTTLRPNSSWGGEGSIGCDIGHGVLHRIPPPRGAAPGVDPMSSPMLREATDDSDSDEEETVERMLQNALEVEFDRSSGEKLGMDLGDHGSTLKIQGISGGQVSAWNASHPSQEVCVGDHIVEVNGIRGNAADVMRELREGTQLRVKIWRHAGSASSEPSQGQSAVTTNGTRAVEEPPIFSMDFRCSPDETLGLQLREKDGRLLIKAITGGIVGKWNSTNAAEEVRAGDRIAEVNGMRGEVPELVAVLRQCKDLQVKIERYKDSVSEGETGQAQPAQGTSAPSVKEQAKPAYTPAAESLIVCANLDCSSGETLGLQLHPNGKTLQIKAISSGLISKWNAAHPGQEVFAGDEMFEVNSLRGAAMDLVKALKGSKELQVKTERSREVKRCEGATTTAGQDAVVEIVCDRNNGESLGLDLVDVNSLLSIKNINGGVVGTWNNSHPGEEVKSGDVIAEVNGVRGDQMSLVAELKRHKWLRVKIERVREEAVPEAQAAAAVPATQAAAQPVVESQQAVVAAAQQPPVVAESPALPAGWAAHVDPGSGRAFYYNQSTGATQWEPPTAQLPASQEGSSASSGQELANGVHQAAATTQAAADASPSALSAEEQARQTVALEQAKQVALPEGWTVHMDPKSGQVFYHNAGTGESRFDVPSGGLTAGGA